MLNKLLNLIIVILILTVVGIETSTYWHLRLQPWQPASPQGRMIFYYSFFTVLSNLMLALGCLILLFKPHCSGSLFRVIRLNGLVGILITAIVYNLVLRGIHRPPTEMLHFTNESLHVVTPVLALISWLIYGPFPRINLKTIIFSFLSLFFYGLYIFIRGYCTRQYPYPFINVGKVGYTSAFSAVGSIIALFFVLVFLLWGIERIRVWMLFIK